MSGRTTHMPYMAAIRLSAGRNSEGALCHGIFHKQEYGSINPTQLDRKGQFLHLGRYIVVPMK